MRGLDNKIFFWLYDFAGRAEWGDALIIFLGEYLIFFLLLTFVIFALRGYLHDGQVGAKPYVYAILASFVARFAVVSSFRFFYENPRPYLALSLSHLLESTTNSFPSGHTITIFSLAGAAWFFNRKLSWFLIVAGLFVGAARVAGGVHYPSDILGGVVLGLLTGAIVYKFLTRAFK
jgi:undecaprenyl-diphosphatase